MAPSSTSTFLVTIASLLGCLVAPGCQFDGEGEARFDDEQTGQAESGLAAEMTNGSAQISYAAKQYHTNPDIAVSQWAEASLSGTHCNGVMIGPNVFFTAAHCGANQSDTITFRTYRNGSASTSETETFNCSYLLQTFNDTDGLLFFCGPNAAGENPGDKYGYVDFDTSAPTLGQKVYSISANPNANGSIPHDARMYASGQVTSVTTTFWATPDAVPGTGITMNLWSEGGMSGSPHFNSANDRMIIAPLSTGSSWSRNAISMKDLLHWGYVNPNFDPSVQAPTVNVSGVTQLGLTPSKYYGYADKNLDDEFDVQYDLERLRGRRSGAGTGSASRASVRTPSGTGPRTRPSIRRIAGRTSTGRAVRGTPTPSTTAG